MKLILSLIAFFGFSASAHAEYNANITAIVTMVITYDKGGILFKVDNEPSSHPACNHSYFSIDTTNADYANRMLSRLLTAKASGERIQIGFDKLGDCHNGYIRTHRVG